MRRVFFISLLLVLLTVVIVWATLRFSDARETHSDSIDAATKITVRRGDAVETIPLSEWLPGVLAAEMPASFAPEALRAQAVAARTYILNRAAHRPSAHPDADVCDDPACCTAWLSEAAMAEKWADGTAANRARIQAAVADTDGEILLYAGEPIRAVFHSSSAGQTESSAALWGDLPYLISVTTPESESDVPNYVNSLEFTADELRSLVLEQHPECELPDAPAEWLGAPVIDSSGRVASQPIGSVTFTGAELRALLGLRSTAYTAAYTDGVFRFTTTGYGHGVGLSQYGANVMAQHGASYTEILLHYYPGTELCKLDT